MCQVYQCLTFSIVIPVYNRYDLTHKLLYDLYRYCTSITEVLVVDDASTEEKYQDGLKWWVDSGLLPVRHIRREENGGFILASNHGLREATGDIVCLLSSDVRVETDISAIIRAMLKVDKKCLVGGRLIDWDSGWNTFAARVYPYLEGWLLATTKANWEELGYLDEDLVPHDFEDVSLSTKALSMDYVLVPLDSPRIVHLGGQTIGFNPAREVITNRNKEIFRQKWVQRKSVKPKK